MTKAVFTSKIGSGYDDIIELYYHFPRTYLRSVEEAVGDLIVYYEPRRGDGELAYFGTAEVVGVRPDPDLPDHFYADLRNYIDFDRKVPFREEGRHYESALRKPDGSHNMGAFQRAVRRIPDEEFAAIVAAGFASASPWPEAPLASAGLAEPEPAPFEYERHSLLLSRPFRDRMFTRRVQQMYDRTCAVTGLRLLNGGGRPEVQAAHIRPVAAAGPDSVRNGVALSGTIHWLFDRGLMTFEDDYSIRTVRGAIPDSVAALISPTGRLRVPDDHQARPSAAFLRYHRENIYKG
jgi:putative restriction endonuclease